MRRSAWFVILGAAVMVGAVGCGDDDGTVIDFDGGPGGDSGPGDGGMVPPDAPDGGPVVCGSIGRVGGACRVGACLDSLTCLEEIRISGAQLTARNAFEIGQAEPEDPTAENPETFVAVETPDPADDIPVTFANGSLCTEQCDSAADTDMCGSCARCSTQLGNDVIGVPVFAFFPAADRAYGTDTGICRSICEFDVDGRGGCPDGYTCDAFTNLCLESCRNDAQCNGTLVITEEGEYGTWIVPDGGRTCNATTGRCDWTQAETETVGVACDRPTDCAEDVGVCLRGGTCAETQCFTASDTDATTGICDGGTGVCLPAGGADGSVCVQGCASSDDCNPGNACNPLIGADGPITVGTFTGYCIGFCDTVDSSTATFTDRLANCGTHDGVVEQCDMPEATADDMDPDGTCRPTCDPDGTPTGCEADELCEAVTGTDYGFCRLLNSFCFEQGDCFGGQVCDNPTGVSTFGRCVDPCDPAADPADCTAPDVCVASGTLTGLCATPCTAATSTTACGTGRICQVPAGMTDGFCVEM